jgi:hypothetical protein
VAVQEHASSATLKLLLLLQECSHLLGLSARSNMHRTKQLCARGDMSPNELPLVIAECDGWMDGWITCTASMAAEAQVDLPLQGSTDLVRKLCCYAYDNWQIASV